MKDQMSRMDAGRFPRSVLALLLALLLSFGWMPGTAYAADGDSRYIFGKLTGGEWCYATK